MAARRTRWNRVQARQMVDDLECSGLTLCAFARSRGLHPQRIRTWRRRFEQEAVLEAPRLVQLVAAAPAATSCLKLCCPSGHVIEVAGIELADGVRALLDALPEPKTC